ncbi:hypothetical protein WMY93_034364 [Mugilogobius chulae]|uniref:Secreted protein n=1 Tax=Mugilogobius chulae TaxID=88201 RepID=A0AAW0MGP7_9GOBI
MTHKRVCGLSSAAAAPHRSVGRLQRLIGLWVGCSASSVCGSAAAPHRSAGRLQRLIGLWVAGCSASSVCGSPAAAPHQSVGRRLQCLIGLRVGGCSASSVCGSAAAAPHPSVGRLQRLIGLRVGGCSASSPDAGIHYTKLHSASVGLESPSDPSHCLRSSRSAGLRSPEELKKSL